MTQYEPTEKNFQYLNGPSGRHGQDDTGLCYICGEPIYDKYVFCSEHVQQFDAEGRGVHWMEWIVNHPDFDGIDFDGEQRRPHIYPQLLNAEDVYLLLRMADP